MSSLISLVVVDQEPRVDSRLLAEQLGVEHKATRQLILQYQADLEEFGKVPFEMEASGKTNQQQKFALLNEDQSYLLLTYSQNTDQARDLKKRLVRAFGEQRRAIALPASPDLPLLESSLVLDFQGVPILFLIALAATKSSGYDDDQVLNTPHVAVPRVDIAVFLCQIGFAPMGEWLVRKAGRTSTCVCSNSPTNALNSVERSLACRSIPA